MVETVTRLSVETFAIYAASEVSNKSRILAVGDTAGASRAGLHNLLRRDVDGLPGKT
ncbi:MAG: hypothetical protein OXI01_13835 [Albidovulum sp.]|nr:hypothetical protein [Albidovulum sp.]